MKKKNAPISHKSMFLSKSDSKIKCITREKSVEAIQILVWALQFMKSKKKCPHYVKNQYFLIKLGQQDQMMT